MTRLPAGGFSISTPRRVEGELKGVFCNLGLEQVFDNVAANELYLKLGAIIGQWSSEQDRLEVSSVAKALKSTANKLREVSQPLSGLETGIRSTPRDRGRIPSNETHIHGSDGPLAVSTRVAQFLLR
jgi:hypothetical protein